MTMDINDLRILITVVSFAVFAGIVAWAWSSRQRARFDEAANLPFADSDLPGDSRIDRDLTAKAGKSGVRS
jgi:cytochrome c oxidase cbb3-type subunit IV